MLSATLARLQNLVHSLERRQLSTLGTVFPRCEHPQAGKPLHFPGEDICNVNFPYHLQPFRANNQLVDNYCIFRDCVSFGQLAPLLLASIMKPNPKLDFKAYSINFVEDCESIIAYPTENETTEIEEAIQQWVKLCDIPNRKEGLIFRRCIVVNFITYFEKEKVERMGHAITLAIEIEGKKLTLKIIEYRLEEEVYSVHNRLFKWMEAAVKPFASGLKIHMETVCLKGKMHIDPDFMTCMSVAYRTCLYLSMDKEIDESDSDFREDSFNMEEHIYSMFRWARDHLHKNHSKVEDIAVLVSPAMTELVYEINNENCYLMLTHRNLSPAKKLHWTKQKITAFIDAFEDTKILRYSPKYGLVQSTN